MRFHSEPMTGAVGEAFAVATLGDDIPGQLVHFPGHHTSPPTQLGCRICPLHQVGDLLHLIVGIATEEGTGDIREVAAKTGSPVDQQHLAFL